MTHIIAIIGAVFASTGFWNWLTQKTKKRSTTEDMILALAHDKIYYLCKKHLREGEISHSEYDNLKHLVEPYFAMGGNGTAAKYWREVDNLPIVED